MTESCPTQPRSWRVRISVRGLMVLVLAVGGGLGWMVHRVRVQRRAVAVIKAAGGDVGYDWSIGGGYLAGGTQAPQWKWLVDAVGVDWLGNVTRVDLESSRAKPFREEVFAEIGKLSFVEDLQVDVGRTEVTDAHLSHLRSLSRLKKLSFWALNDRTFDLSIVEDMTQLEDLQFGFFPLGDADIAHISGLTRLKALRIVRMFNEDRPIPSITDAGLAALEPLRNLEDLRLEGVPITTVGLGHLREMNRLRRLVLRSTGVTGLSPLGQLAGLEELNLALSPITDEGLAPVAKFTGLQTLNLRATPIGDGGMAHLRHLPVLKSLDIAQTKVTDAGLAHLGGLVTLEKLNAFDLGVGDPGLAKLLACPRLESLYLGNTGLTDDVLARLAAMPSCTDLEVRGTRVTPAGLARVARPGLTLKP